MSSKLRGWLLALAAGGCIVTAGIAVLCYLAAADSEAPHPVDQVLISRFEDHRGEFDRLIAVTGGDDGVRFPLSSSRALTDANREDYRQLFLKLDLKGDLKRRPEAPCTLFITGSTRFADMDPNTLETEVTEKGYAYSTVPLAPTAELLDGRPEGRAEIIYRPLGGND